jgi:hypothetical protein
MHVITHMLQKTLISTVEHLGAPIYTQWPEGPSTDMHPLHVILLNLRACAHALTLITPVISRVGGAWPLATLGLRPSLGKDQRLQPR